MGKIRIFMASEDLEFPYPVCKNNAYASKCSDVMCRMVFGEYAYQTNDINIVEKT